MQLCVEIVGHIKKQTNSTCLLKGQAVVFAFMDQVWNTQDACDLFSLEVWPTISSGPQSSSSVKW